MTQMTLEFTDEEKRRAKSHSDEILRMLLVGPVSSTRLQEVTHRFSACIFVLCDTCHERIHGYSAVKLSFPSHVSAAVHRQLQPVSEGAAR